MTKKAVKEKCREIISRHTPGEFLTGDDLEFVLSVLKQHPYYDLKKGPGISGLYVKRNPPYQTLGFWIKRVTGSHTDFSFHECISVGKKRAELDFKMAMRAALVDEVERINNLLLDNGTRYCTSCGKIVYPSTGRVMYKKELREIQREFIEIRGLSDFETLITENPNGVIGVRIKDDGLLEDWLDYHAEHARYIILCSECLANIK